MADTATPRPWRMDEPGMAGVYTLPAENGNIWGTTIRSADRTSVAHLTWCDKYPENLTNAALIVKAVNLHDELVAALQKIRARNYSPILNKICDTALAKAGA